jgi:hypothetical protein
MHASGVGNRFSLVKHKNKPTIVDMGCFFRWGAPAAILGGAWSKPPPCNKLDVADRIAVNICMHHDVLEIDVPASNVKISKQLMTGEAFFRWGATAAILETARASSKSFLLAIIWTSTIKLPSTHAHARCWRYISPPQSYKLAKLVRDHHGETKLL